MGERVQQKQFITVHISELLTQCVRVCVLFFPLYCCRTCWPFSWPFFEVYAMLASMNLRRLQADTWIFSLLLIFFGG